MATPAGSPRPWSLVPGGIAIAVRLTPKAARDAVEGIECRADGLPVLKVRVRAIPREGEANEALLKVIASALGVPVARVSLVAGATARIKRIKVDGDGAALAAALERQYSPTG